MGYIIVIRISVTCAEKDNSCRQTIQHALFYTARVYVRDVLLKWQRSIIYQTQRCCGSLFAEYTYRVLLRGVGLKKKLNIRK